MIYNIKDFGAVADGKTINTKAIQNAIDTCFENGGGQVLAENGTYMFGTIVLRSNVELHIAANATLLGSPNMEDYPEREDVKHIKKGLAPRTQNACYIYCEESENVAITGLGKIDCNGKSFVVPLKSLDEWKSSVVLSGPDPQAWRFVRIPGPTPPRVIFFAGCKNVKFEDFTVINQPAGWCMWITDCDYVSCDKLKINCEVEYPNNDGIHINSSRNVTVSNCDITCGDDCIIVRANNKALPQPKICEKITVTNCNLTSYSAGVRIGWCCDGVIRNCTFSNIVMTDCSTGIDIRLPAMNPNPEEVWVNDFGIEETLIENFTFDNIIMDKVFSEPVKLWIHANTEWSRVKAFRNMYFSNIHTSSPQGIQIEGRPENIIKNIRFSDCTFTTVPYSVFNDTQYHGSARAELSHGVFPLLKYCDGVVFNNVEFRNED